MTAALNWTLFANSLLVAVISTLTASLLGLAYAIAMNASPRSLRRLLLAGAVATLALPSFLVTNSWIDLFGATGWLSPVLPLNLYSLLGVIWVLSLILWPIPAIACACAWNHLEPVHFEVDPALRSTNLLRWLLWPTARAMTLTSSGVVLALAATNFTIPAILQVRVFAAESWIAFNTNLDASAARWLSAPLLIAPLALLLCARQRQFPWPRESATDISTIMRRQLGRGLCSMTFVVAGVLVLLALALPLVQLLGNARTWNEFGPAVQAGIPALVSSVSCAAASAILATAFGLILARVRWMGWLWLLFLAPGILLGITVVEWLNRPGLEWLSRTGIIVVTLLAVRHIALARAVCRTALGSVDSLLLDAGRLEGATGLTLFRCVTWPQIARAVAGAGYLIYLFCLWDVESILMVVPPGGETLALRVFNLLHYGHNSHVNALCVLLLLLALAPLILLAGWTVARRARRSAGSFRIDEA
jgi:iron(III) transport system permease protein